MLLTYSDGQFELTGRSSIFPTHAWFVNGRKVGEQGQVSVGTSVEATKLLKVMKRGAPSKPWTPLLGASRPSVRSPMKRNFADKNSHREAPIYR